MAGEVGVCQDEDMSFSRHHVPHFSRRIIGTFDLATDAQLNEGADWYGDARAFCGDLAKQFGVSLEASAGIVAVLSPMTGWSENKRRATSVLEGANGGMLNAGKAVAIREGADPALVASGQKVNPFYRAILGDPDALVIDRHAHDIALGRRTDDDARKTLERKGQYGLFVEAYRRAADRLGCEAVTVQATTWVVWRAMVSRQAY